MKRRLDLAAALVHNPEVLFLDEPTTGLDPHSRAAVWSEVARLNRELGMTIFLTTQYLDEADTLADRVGIISSGRLVAEGSPAALKHSVGHDVIVAEVEGDDAASTRGPRAPSKGSSPPGTPTARLTVNTPDGAAALGTVAMTLGRTGLQIKSLTMRTPTLDDVFMAMTGSRIERERGAPVTASSRPVSSGGKQASSTTFGQSPAGPSARSHGSPPRSFPLSSSPPSSTPSTSAPSRSWPARPSTTRPSFSPWPLPLP